MFFGQYRFGVGTFRFFNRIGREIIEDKSESEGYRPMIF